MARATHSGGRNRRCCPKAGDRPESECPHRPPCTAVKARSSTIPPRGAQPTGTRSSRAGNRNSRRVRVRQPACHSCMRSSGEPTGRARGSVSAHCLCSRFEVRARVRHPVWELAAPHRPGPPRFRTVDGQDLIRPVREINPGAAPMPIPLDRIGRTGWKSPSGRTEVLYPFHDSGRACGARA